MIEAMQQDRVTIFEHNIIPEHLGMGSRRKQEKEQQKREKSQKT